MDENEYRATYQEINRCRCVFEKALNSRVCSCKKSSRFNLADREGVACDTPAGQALCAELLQLLRHNARFTLHLTRIDGPLPHASEIRIQNGGLLGLQKALSRGHQEQPNVGNIHGLIAQAIARYENLDNLPYLDIVKSVLSYTIRQKRPKY